MSSSRTASIALKLDWRRQVLFSDLRVRYGIKVALAGLLALFCAQLLRLPSANWAILTVITLMRPQFVGSSAFKSIMRMAGTLAGAIVGIWLVGDFSSTPAIFLPIFFVVMTFAGYKLGQLGARQIPYAYFLLGVTTVVVASDGIMNPGQVWQVGLDRTEEIFLGITCSFLVTTLIWPRYAQKEFISKARETLRMIGELVSLRVRVDTTTGNEPVESSEIYHRCLQQLSALRNLLNDASRESSVLSVQNSNYSRYLISLSNSFYAISDLARYSAGPPCADLFHEELGSVFAGLLEELEILANSVSPGEELQSSSMNKAFAYLEAKADHFRIEGILGNVPIETLAAFPGYLSSLHSLCDELNNIHRIVAGQPPTGRSLPHAATSLQSALRIDWFWVKVAVKGGLAAVLAMVFLMWIQPPGGTSTPVWAWLLVVLERPFFKVSGTGDLRAFQTSFAGCLILSACAALNIFISPLLSNYTFMNLVLFVALFALSFLTAHTQGLNFWTEFAALTISPFVALNPQQAVPAQTVINTYLGLMFGILIATVVGRWFWPVLPHRILRDTLFELLTGLKALLRGDRYPEKVRSHLEILPMEALRAVRRNRVAAFSEEEKWKMSGLIGALRKVVPRIQQLVVRRDELPEISAAVLRPQLECLEIEFCQVISAIGECLRTGDCDGEIPSFVGALAGLDHAVQQIRNRALLGDLTPEASLQVFDLVYRYHAVGDGLLECGCLVKTLQIHRYWGDYFL